MSRYQYPINFKFKITTFSNDFVATDATGNTIFYAREKILTWRDKIFIYNDDSKSETLYELISNKLIDFQQTFTISRPSGEVLGRVRRKSIRSLWRTTVYLRDSEDNHDYTITEINPWTKFWDGLFGEIPIIGMLSGYIFNPGYRMKNQSGEDVFEVVKNPSFFGRRFTLNKYKEELSETEEERLLMSMVLLVLLERSRG